jgi:uncharacterized membrane protein YGL010W
MKTAEEWFSLYGESHRNPINKLIHWICIPAILVSFVGLLAAIPPPFGVWWLSPAVLALGGALAWYGLVSLRLALGMAVVFGGVVASVAALSSLSVPLWVSSLAIFMVAWVAQFVGHKIEGKKPSFFEDLQFLLIGPLWLLGHIYRRAGLTY